MSEVLHANIFFVIASVATVIFSILICIALYQVFKILKLIRSILERIEAASETVAHDIAEARSFVAKGGFFGRILNFMMGSVAESQRRRRKRSRE